MGRTASTRHNVRGMGRAKAQRLFYGMLVNRLRGNSDFYDMARQMLAEAKGLRGIGFFDNADVCTVLEAYAAVELGPADRDCNGVEDSMEDSDGDGVPNAYNDTAGTVWDNCRTVRNPNQADLDGDGIGDACDRDSDSDGVYDFLYNDPKDNCRWVYNPSQNDRDKDGVGDACDNDTDGDNVPNADRQLPDHLQPRSERCGSRRRGRCVRPGRRCRPDLQHRRAACQRAGPHRRPGLLPRPGQHGGYLRSREGRLRHAPAARGQLPAPPQHRPAGC